MLITDFKDIDGRSLTFQNDQRPARRYLYFRYCMAIWHAQKRNWKIETKVPRGNIWASPNKPDGYLRSSVLRSLARKIGEKELEEELFKAGTFQDTEPGTTSDLSDQLATHGVAMSIRTHMQKQKEMEKETAADSEDSDSEDLDSEVQDFEDPFEDEEGSCER